MPHLKPILFFLFFSPIWALSQDHVPADGIITCVDNPQVRKGLIIEYSANFVRFRPAENPAQVVELGVEQVLSITLLKSRVRLERWSINGAPPILIEIQSKAGALKLAHELEKNREEWLLLRDTQEALVLNRSNYLAVLDSLTPNTPVIERAFGHLRFKRNNMGRFLNYFNSGQKGIFSYLRLGTLGGIHWENIKVNRLMGSGFKEGSTSAYGQRFHAGAWADIPFGLSNQFSFVAEALFVSDDQAFVGPKIFDQTRQGLSMSANYLEIPLMGSRQLPVLSNKLQLIPFVRVGLTLRQRISSQVLRYRVLPSSERVVATGFSPVDQGSPTDFGLTASLALAHPLSNNSVLEVHLRYMYFLQRELYSGRLRLTAALAFGR